MKKESLEIVREKIIEVVSNEDIDTLDKMELLINLYNFLDIGKYNDNIKILKLGDDKYYVRRNDNI